MLLWIFFLKYIYVYKKFFVYTDITFFDFEILKNESLHLLLPDLGCFDPEGPHDGGPVGEGNLDPEDDQRLRPDPGQRAAPADHPPAGLCSDER